VADDFYADGVLDDLAAGGGRKPGLKRHPPIRFDTLRDRRKIGRRRRLGRPGPGLGVRLDRRGLLDGGVVLLTAAAMAAAGGTGDELCQGGRNGQGEGQEEAGG
jgi:hypothetical protein